MDAAHGAPGGCSSSGGTDADATSGNGAAAAVLRPFRSASVASLTRSQYLRSGDVIEQLHSNSDWVSERLAGKGVGPEDAAGLLAALRSWAGPLEGIAHGPAREGGALAALQEQQESGGAGGSGAGGLSADEVRLTPLTHVTVSVRQ